MHHRDRIQNRHEERKMVLSHTTNTPMSCSNLMPALCRTWPQGRRLEQPCHPTGWGPPVMWTLVYKPWNNPHELVRYIYHKPLNSATYKPTERYLKGAPSCTQFMFKSILWKVLLWDSRYHRLGYFCWLRQWIKMLTAWFQPQMANECMLTGKKETWYSHVIR